MKTAKFKTRTGLKGKRSRYGVGRPCLFSWVLGGTSTSDKAWFHAFFVTYLLGTKGQIKPPFMKHLLLLTLFTILHIGSFCQSNTYEAFLFRMDYQQLQRFTFPIKILKVEDGTYEIFTNPPEYKNSKLQFNGKYIEYDKWERLYKYRSIRKWYSGGVKRNDNFEYTTETFITCRTKLSDYINGLTINVEDINENYQIDIKEVTSSKWTKEEIHFYTIIPFNLKNQQEVKENDKSIDVSDNVKTSDTEYIQKSKEEEQRLILIAEQQRKSGVISNRAKNAFGSNSIKNSSSNVNEQIPVSDNNNGLSYTLNGRTAIYLPKPHYPGNNEANVAIKITVNKNGNVTKAESDFKDSNTSYPELVEAAIKAAKQARFNVDNNAPEAQIGTITYHFVLD